MGAEFSDGREWLGLSREELGEDTLLELRGMACGKGQSACSKCALSALLLMNPLLNTYSILQVYQQVGESGSSLGLLSPAPTDDVSEPPLGKERERLGAAVADLPNETLRRQMLVGIFQGEQLVDYSPGYG